jgi:hypothetical protein
MPAEIELAPVDDVFLEEVELPLRTTFYPLGFPFELATNAEEVLSAVNTAWGMFEAAYQKNPLSLELTVTESDDDRLPPYPKFRTHRHMISIVADARNHVICDFEKGCAVGWVTRLVAEHPSFLRLHLLEPSVMTMLVAAHLAPIHGALVTRGGIGVALCGESCAGKSTLAYSCARNGWTLVSDDGTFLVRGQPGSRAVGNPQGVRFREDAKVLFPELAECRVASRPPYGKWGIEARTSDLPIATADSCSIDHLVFLRRSHSGPARLTRFDPKQALAWLERAILYGPAEAKLSQREAYRRLVERGVWELHYSDLAGALQQLNGLAASF